VHHQETLQWSEVIFAVRLYDRINGFVTVQTSRLQARSNKRNINIQYGHLHSSDANKRNINRGRHEVPYRATSDAVDGVMLHASHSPPINVQFLRLAIDSRTSGK